MSPTTVLATTKARVTRARVTTISHFPQVKTVGCARVPRRSPLRLHQAGDGAVAHVVCACDLACRLAHSTSIESFADLVRRLWKSEHSRKSCLQYAMTRKLPQGGTETLASQARRSTS